MLQKIGLFISLWFLLGQIACGQPSSKPLRVITYNIWNGFDWGKDTARHNQFLDWAKFKKPDVLALQELCGYTPEKLKADASKWGHSYAEILKIKGYPVGITSNAPIEVLEKKLDDMWHGMLVVKTHGIYFLVVHFSPADWAFRKREANLVVDKRLRLDGPFMVLGDFNAHSPMDADLDRTKLSLLARKKLGDASNEKYNNLNSDYFDYSVIATLLGVNLRDVTMPFVKPEDRFSFPVKGLVNIWQTATEVTQHRERIDYILCTPDLARQCVYS